MLVYYYYILFPCVEHRQRNDDTRPRTTTFLTNSQREIKTGTSRTRREKDGGSTGNLKRRPRSDNTDWEIHTTHHHHSPPTKVVAIYMDGVRARLDKQRSRAVGRLPKPEKWKFLVTTNTSAANVTAISVCKILNINIVVPVVSKLKNDRWRYPPPKATGLYARPSNDPWATSSDCRVSTTAQSVDCHPHHIVKLK